MCNYPLCQAIALLIPPYVIQFWEEKVGDLVHTAAAAVPLAATQSSYLWMLVSTGQIIWSHCVWRAVWRRLVVLGGCSRVHVAQNPL